MKHPLYYQTVAVAALMCLSAPAVAQETAPDETIYSFGGDIDPFKGDIDPFGGDIDPFGGDIDTFAGDIDTFAGDIDTFGGDINPFRGDIDPLAATSIHFTETSDLSGATSVRSGETSIRSVATLIPLAATLIPLAATLIPLAEISTRLAATSIRSGGISKLSSLMFKVLATTGAKLVPCGAISMRHGRRLGLQEMHPITIIKFFGPRSESLLRSAKRPGDRLILAQPINRFMPDLQPHCSPNMALT